MEELHSKFIQQRAAYIEENFKIQIQQRVQVLSKVNKMIDHTLLQSDITPEQIARLCSEAKEHGFASVCVNGCYCDMACELLRGSDVMVCCVAGFPLGAATTEAKVFETRDLISRGADEIDVVINCAWMKANMYSDVHRELCLVVNACHEKQRVVKVIIETACLQTPELIVDACMLCQAAGADFVKTSTGMHKLGGATPEHVLLIRTVAGKACGVKAAGGVRDLRSAALMLECGANRIGTSSGVNIAKEAKEKSEAQLQEIVEQARKEASELMQKLPN